MWHISKGWRASLLAVALVSAGALQASGQVTPQQVQETAAATAPASAAPQLTSADVHAWLDGVMPLALSNADIVGAVVTITHNGQVVANRGYGYSDLAARTPVDPATTLFRPGSISKLFTWTAVMQQVEAGTIDLDADINTYIDYEIPAYDGQPITMRQIMTHTTGFEEVIRDLISSDPASGSMSLGDYLKNHIPARIYPPGTMPAYSNYATALAGYVVERVSGEPFADYIHAHIFEPLGMTHSTFVQPLPEGAPGIMSGGYKNGADGEAGFFEVIPAAPAGSLTTTSGDMALFMNAHLNNGAGLLRPETAQQMHETVDQQFSEVNSMLLGFYQENYAGQRIIAHGGDTTFFHSNLSLLMDQNVGVYISLNSGGSGTPVAALLRWEFMEQFVNRYFPSTGPRPEQVALPTAQQHGAALVGDWESARRAETSPLLVAYFLGQTTIAMLPNGDLVGPGLPEVNGSQKHWREVEPWIWQAVGGDERLSARVDENGNVTAIAFEPLSFAIPSTRAPGYRGKSLLMPLLGVSLLVLLLTLVSWPLRAMARRSFKTTFPYEGSRAAAHRLGAGAALLAIVYLSAWIGFVLWLMESLTSNTGSMSTTVLTVLYVAGLLPVLALAGGAYANFSLWRAPSTWFAKIWGLLLLLSLVVILWFAIAMNFFSFQFNY
jgi:CubicO group peptidase (beta-lactamase class C family)